MSGWGDPAPVFKPASSMSKAAFKRFSRWECWLLKKALVFHQTGLFGMPEGLDLYQQVYIAFYALHSGALGAVEDAAGGSILDGMPAAPDVWPEGFPLELAKAFVGYLMDLESDTR